MNVGRKIRLGNISELWRMTEDERRVLGAAVNEDGRVWVVTETSDQRSMLRVEGVPFSMEYYREFGLVQTTNLDQIVYFWARTTEGVCTRFRYIPNLCTKEWRAEVVTLDSDEWDEVPLWRRSGEWGGRWNPCNAETGSPAHPSARAPFEWRCLRAGELYELYVEDTVTHKCDGIHAIGWEECWPKVSVHILAQRGRGLHKISYEITEPHVVHRLSLVESMIHAVRN